MCRYVCMLTRSGSKPANLTPFVWFRFRRQILYFLSGLTCTDENFITKAGAPRVAAAKGIALVCPDTSPRGANIEGEDESWDFGTGAGFYVDATEEPWSANYKMYTYVTEELPALLAAELPLDVSNASVTGHSMGGHGALVVGLKNPVCPAGYRAAVPCRLTEVACYCTRVLTRPSTSPCLRSRPSATRRPAPGV